MELGARSSKDPVNYRARYLILKSQVSRKLGCVLTSNEVRFDSLAEKLYRIIFKSFETPIWNGKENSLTGPVITGSFEKRTPGPTRIKGAGERGLLSRTAAGNQAWVKSLYEKN